MSIMTSTSVSRLRTALRKAGVVELVRGALASIGIDYETLLTRSIVKVINDSDSIWDVGANIGYYTYIFSKHVGGYGDELIH
jgi:hypothetical protein